MKGQLSVLFSIFFAVVSQHLSAQSYTARTVVLFKQILAVVKEKGHISEGTVKIINELLTTLVYKIFLKLSEWKATIFIGTLI